MRMCALIALPLLLLGTAAPAGAAGDPAVAALQAVLATRGLYAGTVDGVKGPQTDAAVVALQTATGLPADGVLGPRTRAALGALGKHPLGTRVLGFGDHGFDVAELQFEVSWHGFPCREIDGDFGFHTDSAIRRFQRFAHLFPDGIVGPATVRALQAQPPTGGVRLHWPVSGLVGSPFGPRGRMFHPGIDIVADMGTPVRSAAAGRVRAAGWFDGYGFRVVVTHGYGAVTLYAHLSRIDVHVGQVVAVGEQLGLVGSTGESTGPHLHLEERVRGAAIDPLPALR
jgi:murein DD-endopeptidase MepM/ murein hydrolase activator NlpD